MGTILAMRHAMRWKASKPELLWKRAYETRLEAILARLPLLACWVALGLSYAGLVAILYVPKVPLFDLVSPLTGHLVGLGVSASIALLIGRRVVLILLAGTILTILGHALPVYLPERPSFSVAPDAQANAGQARDLRVMAFNVWYQNRDPDLMFQVIATSGADVVLLSEVTPELGTSLQGLRETYPFAVYCGGKAPCTQMLLSKIPLGASGTVPATRNEPAMVWATLAGHGPAAGITVVSTHLYRPSRHFVRHQLQLEGLIARLNRFNGPLIVGGDFNATTSTRSYQELIRRAGLSGSGRHLPSWPAHPWVLPQVGLDHVLVRGLTVRESGLGAYGGSDHLPVWSRIVRPDEKPGGV